MEEQILKIIESNYNYPEGATMSAKEITSHVMEFIEFIRTNCEGMDQGWNYYEKVTSIRYFGTTGKLYQYWLTHVK
jgi:hypothetical protein